MADLTKDQALMLANIIVPAVQKHAKDVLDSLDDEDKREMHPMAFASLQDLAGITGTFCSVQEQINKIIDSLGWLAKMFLGNAYALLLTFQTVLKEIAKVLCPPKP